MKIQSNCGLSLKVTSYVTCTVEVLFSLIIVALAIHCWVTVDKPIQFLYTATSNSTIERHRGLEGCVITWALTILMSLCAWRIISAAILSLALHKYSCYLAQYWIAYKVVTLLLSICIGIVAFTSNPLKPTALLSLATDLITSYFILILYPQVEKFEKK